MKIHSYFIPNKIFAIIFISLFFFKGELFAQSEESNPLINFDYFDTTTFDIIPEKLFTKVAEPTDTIFIKLAMVSVGYSNGTGQISSAEKMTALRTLNGYFKQAKIQFIPYLVEGIGLNSDDLAVYDRNEATPPPFTSVKNYLDWLLNQDIYHLYLSSFLLEQNAMFVFFIPEMFVYGKAFRPGTVCMVRNDRANTSTLAHEIGHNLNLIHTHGEANIFGFQEQELVNGDNCPTAGDELCDTNAEPFNDGDGINGKVFNCIYSGMEKDANGDFYTPNTDNFMSYSQRECRIKFTAGQIERMWGALSSVDRIKNSIVSRNYATIANKRENSEDLLNGTLGLSLLDKFGNKVSNNTLNSGDSYSVYSGLRYEVITNHQSIENRFHKNWSKVDTLYHLKEQTILSNLGNSVDARFFQSFPISFNQKLDGIISSLHNSTWLRDPWLCENGTQPNLFKSVYGIYSSFLNEYPDLAKPKVPYYGIKAATNVNEEAYFLNWSATGASIPDIKKYDEQSIVFTSSNSTVTANYKGHLRTGVPDLSDAKNQRRYLINGLVSNKQVMVYESMGHVWISHSTDGGATWSAEKRLSGINGGANPTLSNMIDWDGSNAYFAVSWVENTSVMIQSMVISGTQLYFGWTNYSTTQNAENLINVSQSKTLEYSLTTGRPALAIQTWFDGGIPKEIDVRFAHETAYGLVFAELRTSGYRRLDLANVITQPPIGGVVAHVSTSSADCQPVLISYPAASGQPAKSVLYYLGTGYAPGYRIVEFDTQTQVKRVLSTASNDYTYHSLAGAVNSTSASFALVATAQVNTPSVAYNTNIYTKPSYYGNSLPTVAKVYTNTVKPAIMVQNTFYFGPPTYQVHMTTNGTTTRVKADGGSIQTTVATNTAGSWLSAQVAIGNRKAMVVSTLQQIPEGPATISYYSGSSQQMNKEGDYQVDVRAFRYFTLKNGKSGSAVLDFSGSQVEAIDSLEVGENLAVVLVKNPASSGVLVYQPDSLVVPLSVDVIRDGKEIAAYAASSWKSLGAASFADLRDGDVLRFRLADPVTATWGYEEYTVTDESMAKEDTPEESVEELESLTEGIKIYPNPFNPVTTIQVSLAEPKMVRLAVYNILGQMVSELVNGELGAGRHSYSFNGSNLSSGTYFYRLEAGGEVTTGKLQLLK